MERFCDELRRERERRKVSIETICAVTKVSSRHVQALESGAYDELPGGVFRKGILRSYLAVLGVDSTAEPGWIERFEASMRESGAMAEAADWGEFAENVSRNRIGSQPQGRLRWMGVFAMVVVLAVCGWAVWRFVVHPHVVTASGRASAITASQPNTTAQPR